MTGHFLFPSKDYTSLYLNYEFCLWYELWFFPQDKIKEILLSPCFSALQPCLPQWPECSKVITCKWIIEDFVINWMEYELKFYKVINQLLNMRRNESCHIKKIENVVKHHFLLTLKLKTGCPRFFLLL